MSSLCIGFIGLGLIGGSLAKSIKRVHPQYRLVAYNRNPNVLQLAKNEGVIEEYSTTINRMFSDCDYIFLCTPVETNEQILSEIKSFIKPTCIISDVGSVKENIHLSVIKEGLESNFIGGHPMSGSEKTGYENSTDHLLENAYYALTPTKSTKEEDLRLLQSLIEDIGALPIVLEYEYHDYVVAAISHLPHLIAASLVNLVNQSDNEQQIMKKIAAGGFKDITRIASSSPQMWQQICKTNAKNISVLLEQYINYLNQIKREVDNSDDHYIFDLFTESKEYRDTFLDSSLGPIKKQYAVYCDVKDETGVIMAVVALLAKDNISIKNIGILHNREFEEGVLHIQFYSEESAKKAVEILTLCHYTVYKR